MPCSDRARKGCCSACCRTTGSVRLPPADAVYVGDGASDMVDAREAGVLAAGAAWAHGVRATDLKDAGADLIFTDAREFLTWLDAATRGLATGAVSPQRPSSGRR